MSSDMSYISNSELFSQLSSNSQVDGDSGVWSVPSQNLQQLEGFLNDKGIALPNDPNASDQQRLGNVMSGLEKAGYQVTQGTSASGAPVYSVSLSSDTKVSVSLPTTDDLESTASSQPSKTDQAVSAQLAGTPATPSSATANPYLNVGTAATLRNVMEELFSKESQVTQLLGDAGIQEVKNAISNTSSKMQAIGNEYTARNVSELGNINYNTTMMAVTGMAGIASLVNTNKANYHNQRAGKNDETGGSGGSRSSESLTLTPEGEQAPSSSVDPHREKADAATARGKLIDHAQSIAQNMAAVQRSSTNISANNQESQAKQDEASLDLNQQMINRNLTTFGQQQQNVHQDAAKTLDLINQFSKTAVDMTRNTFSQA